VHIAVRHRTLPNPQGIPPVELKTYELQIKAGEQLYFFPLTQTSEYQLEWQINDPIEFRFNKNKMFLRRPNGKEFQITLLKQPPKGLEEEVELSKQPASGMEAKQTPARNTDAGKPPPPDHKEASAALAPFDRISNANPTSFEATPSLPRCVALREGDPQLGALEQTCDFALRFPRSLPDFICQETAQHFVGNSKRLKWKSTDIVTAEVTFERGKETYSNVTVNGRPLDLPPSARSGQAFSQYLISQGQRGVWDLDEFGSNLMMLFREASQTSFESRGEATVAGTRAIVFDFDIERAHSPFQFLWATSSGSSPEGSTSGGEEEARYGVEGSIWVDEATPRLLRVELNATDFPKGFPISSSSSATNYDVVLIGEAGAFLLPVASESMECSGDEHRCYRDVLEFHSCRKFGAESRIVTK